MVRAPFAPCNPALALTVPLTANPPRQASQRMGAVAAQLLGVPRVRLYQSCVFIKEPGMGDTNWHSDLNMVPLDTNAFVTAWLPLRSLRAADAALAFASGSHRDFALPYWMNEAGLAAGLEGRYEVESYAPLALGDATWHAGWTLHSAPGQPASEPARVALAASYFADGARRLTSRCVCSWHGGVLRA